MVKCHGISSRPWTFVLILVSASICTTPAWAQYTQRYRTVSNGAVTFAGNTLGLDGAANENGQGTRGSIGTFITTDTTQRDTRRRPPRHRYFPSAPRVTGG
jgi:cytochrome c biogenesis factor